MDFFRGPLIPFLTVVMFVVTDSSSSAGGTQDSPKESPAFHNRFYLPYLKRTPGNHAVRSAAAWRELIAKNTDADTGPAFDVILQKNPVDFEKHMVLAAAWEVPNLQSRFTIESAVKSEKEIRVRLHAWRDSIIELPTSRAMTWVAVTDRSDLPVRFEIVRMPPPHQLRTSIGRIRDQLKREVSDEEALEIIRKMSANLLTSPGDGGEQRP
jgi:hypothetical protein